jgi:hypothetical protein
MLRAADGIALAATLLATVDGECPCRPPSPRADGVAGAFRRDRPPTPAPDPRMSPPGSFERSFTQNPSTRSSRWQGCIDTLATTACAVHRRTRHSSRPVGLGPCRGRTGVQAVRPSFYSGRYSTTTTSELRSNDSRTTAMILNWDGDHGTRGGTQGLSAIRTTSKGRRRTTSERLAVHDSSTARTTIRTHAADAAEFGAWMVDARI